jgi:2,4-dienoyl-CoA reductase-like NADH-dependent reductase (Old Yellow Enzyme family)/thioredoxin reductase
MFEHLLKPLEIGTIHLKNRIIMPPMATNYATDEGFVTDLLKAHLEKRAKGGTALIIPGMTCVDAPVGKGVPRQLCCHDDKLIPGLSKLAEAVHKWDAAIGMQLVHGGCHASSRYTGHQPVGPSPLAAPGMETPHALSVSEIAEVVEKFVNGAERAKKAGFDGVEIHATHGYLLYSFLSPLSNIREDQYGGDLENRARIVLEIVEGIKQRNGGDFPIWVRLSAKEFGIDGGITLDESRQFSKWLEQAGCAAISVSSTAYASRGTLHMQWEVPGETYGRPPIAHPYGYLLPTIQKVKEAVSIPIIAVGRITPEVAERAIAQGQTDAVAMGRAHVADPELVNKITAGRLDEIRPCVGCNECLQRLLGADGNLHCSVNPVTGRDLDLSITPAEKKKKVVVVGGGPGGMEAASVAAQRGHEVILNEKGPKLGGKVLTAAAPVFKDELLKFVSFQEKELDRLGVKIALGTEATAESVMAHGPDAVVIATGSIRGAIDFPGAGKNRVVDAEDVLNGTVAIGNSIAIIGGGMVGCETAEFLADQGKKVTIVEMLDALPLSIESIHSVYLPQRLNRRGVTILLNTKAMDIAAPGLIISCGEGHRQMLQCDTVVMAVSPRPNEELYDSLKGKVPEVYQVGDCIEPRRITDAVLEGFMVGLEKI